MLNLFIRVAASFALCIFFSLNSFAQNANDSGFWLELKAQNKQDRNRIVNLGFDIVSVEKDRVIILASEAQLQIAFQKDLILASYRADSVSPYGQRNFDPVYHSYADLVAIIKDIAAKNPDIVELTSIGQSYQKQEIWSVRISANLHDVQPAALFVGGHHAREHVSMEIPLRLLDYLVDQYRKQNSRVVSLLNTNEVLIIPVLNPDGADYDNSAGGHKSWRKNRRINNDNSLGVDLNRNYDLAWGTTGTSSNTHSDTYMGLAPFSEPETQAFKTFVEANAQITTLLSYHTFGQNIMWPWSYSDDDIPDAKDLKVFKAMAIKMAKWTGYTAMKSGDMYLSSGDTCDWAYGKHGIFAFTFELDPSSMYQGGFYPAQTVLDGVFNKNLEAALYLMESAGSPYKAVGL